MSNKKQTSMMELINYLKDYDNKGVFDSSKIWLTPIEYAESLLPKEREEIEDAYCDGRLSVINREIINSRQYFEETFKQD